MLWVGRDHYNDEFCAGTLVAGLYCVCQHRAFRRACRGDCVQDTKCTLHGIVVLQVLSYNAPASVSCFVCRQALVRRIQAGVLVHACRMSSLEIALRWWALIHASGPSVLSTSRWRACRPHRLGSQAAAGGSGLPVLLAGSGMHQYMCVFVAESGLVPTRVLCQLFSASCSWKVESWEVRPWLFKRVSSGLGLRFVTSGRHRRKRCRRPRQVFVPPSCVTMSARVRRPRIMLHTCPRMSVLGGGLNECFHSIPLCR